MHDVSQQSENIQLLQLSINRELIENVKHFKFLCILIDESLTWKCHINMLTNKNLK